MRDTKRDPEPSELERDLYREAGKRFVEVLKGENYSKKNANLGHFITAVDCNPGLEGKVGRVLKKRTMLDDILGDLRICMVESMMKGRSLPEESIYSYPVSESADDDDDEDEGDGEVENEELVRKFGHKADLYLLNSMFFKFSNYAKIEDSGYKERFMRFLAWKGLIYPQSGYMSVVTMLKKKGSLRKRLCEAVESGGSLDEVMEDLCYRLLTESDEIRVIRNIRDRTKRWGASVTTMSKKLRQYIDDYRGLWGIERKDSCA